MKNNQLPKALIYLMVAGILLVTVVPAVSHYFKWPDTLTGFAMGVGIGLEILALISKSRFKRKEA